MGVYFLELSSESKCLYVLLFNIEMFRLSYENSFVFIGLLSTYILQRGDTTPLTECSHWVTGEGDLMKCVAF